MLSSLLLLSALAGNPAHEFTSRYPGSSTLAAADGQLVHASGFLFESGARRPEGAAAAFLRLHGAAFGAAPARELVLRGAPAAGHVGAVRFERHIGGLTVFGGDLVVGVDGAGRVFAVNAADVPPSATGRHAIGEATARAAALAAFPGGARGAGPASVTAGWRTMPSVVRAVYRVDFVAAEPPGDWRVYVDGETSAPLFVEDLRFYASAPGSVFEVSPVETAAAACPPSGSGGLSFCASPVSVTLNNLVAAPPTTLAGTQTTVYNCKGANAPASVPGPCSSVSSTGGGFAFAVDGTFLSTTDDFSAAMAYYHLDKHVKFFKALDPTLPGGTSLAINGSLPGLVNAFQANAPLENAFYSGGLDAMVFGQGASADYAYDATVIYHEFTHGVVQAWGGYAIGIDSLGGLDEPGAVNEGTADSMAVSETGHSSIGAFIESTSTPAGPFLRDMNDPTAKRTCQGDGTVVTQLGASTINGLDGEVHDDGEIWNGFFWEVYQGLKSGGIKGCGGACEAAPAIQYQTMQLAGGTSPTLNSYWQTFKSAASALFPSQPAVTTYVDCVARRRKLDGCDRTVPVYAGETKVEFVRLRFSTFQMVIDVTDPATFSLGVCSARGTPTTLRGRVGAAVQITSLNPDTFVETDSVPFTQACSGGMSTFNGFTPAGRWYLLFDSPNALVGQTPGFDAYKVSVSATGAATRPAGTSPPTCTPPSSGITISPPSATVPPRGTQTFTASGGSGALTWSLQTNASGSTIVAATGAYTAGPTGGVTDVVKVTDAAASTATANVTVTAGVSISPATASAPPRGSLGFTASGGSGTGFVWSLATSTSGGSISAGGAYTAGPTGGVTDVVQVTDSLGNVATRSVAVTAGVSVSPATASAPPRGSLAFTASGGSGAGFAWSLATNASGGSITAGGAYAAGPTGGVTDVVQVSDSLGNVATRSVAVTAGVSVSPVTASAPPGGSLAFTASGGSGTGFAWSLATNASGGSITAGGAYTAGPTGGVTDVVQVADSLGNTATASVTVTAPPPGGAAKSGGCGCGASAGSAPILAAGLAALLRRRRRSAEPAPVEGDR